MGLLAARATRASPQRSGGTLLEVVQDRVPGSRSAAVRASSRRSRRHSSAAAAVCSCTGWTASARQARRGVFSSICTAPIATFTTAIQYRAFFSFNSPVGACETCRGFGRTMGIDYDLVVPDSSLSPGDGAVKTWQTKRYRSCQRDLHEGRTRAQGADRCAVAKASRRRQRAGCSRAKAKRRSGKWYGVKRFFDWLETKAYQDARPRAAVAISRVRPLRPTARARVSSPRPCRGGWARSADAARVRAPPNDSAAPPTNER